MNDKDIEKIEIELILEAIFKRYGYDFRNYAKASLKRRLLHRMSLNKLGNLSEMIEKIIHDEEFMDSFLVDMSIVVTDMFRDPHFYKAVREKVVPLLKTYPFIKIWHAGCATGEEVYSLAIILKEEGFLDRTQIYATDYNVYALESAKKGIYSVDRMEQYNKNYIKAGGKRNMKDYFSEDYMGINIKNELKENVTFARHNLVCDGVFGEMHLIFCRNVLIYFDSDLQNRVLNLFKESLCRRGILCLGTKESLSFTSVKDSFDTFVKHERIYQKLQG